MRQALKKLIPLNIKILISEIFRGNYSYYFYLLPIKKNKIVFSSYYGKGYGDNGKYIAERLIKGKHDVEIVWLVKNSKIEKKNFPNEIRLVEYGTIKALYELATSKIWVDNCRKEYYPPKSKKQYYIQTWHSPLRLKRIEADAEENLPKPYIKLAKKDAKICDLMIAGNDFSQNLYSNSFWYKNKILKCGTPRCDILLSDSYAIKEKVYSHFNITSQNKLLLYAPTFRKNLNTNAYKLEFERVIQAIKERFGSEWKVLIRLHPNVSEKANFIEYDDNIINATQYNDMQELLSASDILITDYSSCMFDMAIANKKCFLFAIDFNQYVLNEREMYFDVEKLPFPLSKNNDELIKQITTFDDTLYKLELQYFFEKINMYENGTASDEIVKVIVDKINRF